VSEEAAAEGSYFLSYSRSDERFALRLANDLRANGIPMWVDQLDIRPSEHWDRAIERAVGACRGIVVILSPRSIASDNVMDEISYAIDSGKSALPVMIERCVLPLRLTRMQVVDATGNYELALQQCLDELMRRDRTAPPPQRRAAGATAFDPAVVARVKEELAAILGPIAGRLVDKAATRAGSVGELYALAAQHICNEAERQQFLARSPASTAPPPGPSEMTPGPVETARPDELESLARLTARYIGPIASIVVKRQSQATSSLESLRQKLAESIPDQADRAEFLRQSAR
jgi:hypothetical protein